MVLDLCHTVFCDVGGGFGKEGMQGAYGSSTKDTNPIEGIRDVCMGEGISELGFGGCIGEMRKRKGQGGLFFQGRGMRKGKNTWNTMAM